METLLADTKEFSAVSSPHSLGTLIEWKLMSPSRLGSIVWYPVPTRWGH